MDFFRISSLSSPGPGHLSLFSKKTKLVFSFQLSYSFVLFLAWSRLLENIWIQFERIVVIFRKFLHDYSVASSSFTVFAFNWKISGFLVKACIKLRRLCHDRLILNFLYVF